MKITLSDTQRRALVELGRRGESCSHELGVSVSTLGALASKGLARCVDDRGRVAMPRACPYRITSLGQNALKELEEKFENGDR